MPQVTEIGLSREVEGDLAFAANGEVKGPAWRGNTNSKGASGTAPARAEKRVCFCCKSEKHLTRYCPHQICQDCGNKGHHAADCEELFEDAVTTANETFGGSSQKKSTADS